MIHSIEEPDELPPDRGVRLKGQGREDPLQPLSPAMSRQAKKVGLQLSIRAAFNPHVRVPVPIPNRVAAELDRLFPTVLKRLLGEELMLPSGGNEDVEPAVPDVLNIRPPSGLAPIASELRYGYPVFPNQLLIDRSRVLPFRNDPRDVEPLAVRDAAHRELLHEAFNRGRFASVFHASPPRMEKRCVIVSSAQSRESRNLRGNGRARSGFVPSSATTFRAL